ncbi:MAG: methyl-accepting chemotaxis protein [Candidatus Binatia bacterium]|nr:methyl-accepting chemotaxis protein [Candidatus Binatia bacterium]
MALLLAGVASSAAFFGSRWLVEQNALRHLEGLRDAAHNDLGTLFDEVGAETGVLAADPRTASAIEAFKDGVRSATVEVADKKPGELEPYQSRLTAFYEAEILPSARSAGRPASLEELYPDDGSFETPNPTVVLQSLYLTEDSTVATDDITKQYGEAYGSHGPWLRDLATRNGWENLHLIDNTSGTIVYSTEAAVETFTNLTDGVHRGSGLALAASRTNAETSAGEHFFADTKFGSVDASPRVFVSAPVFSGERRIGTIVAAIDTAAIDRALLPGTGAEKWARANLGAGGQVLALAGDGALRSTPRHASNPGQTSAGLREALAGTSTTGTFDVGGNTTLASYGPIDVGGNRWVIAAERPQSEVVAPLALLLPVLLGIVFVATLAGWMLGSRLWSQFAGRLRKISSVVQKAQRGDRKARLEVDQEGAVGELAATINRLLEDRASVIEKAELEHQRLANDAEQLLEVARTAAHGGPVVHAQINGGALATVSSALNEMLDTIGTLSESIHEASALVGTSATQIRASADETSTNAAQQTRVCGETEGSAQALRTEGSRIAEKCSEALEVARRTEQATRSGQAALTDLLTGMDGLQRETRAATVKIKRLGERSMQISAIIGTISKMSAQTDMLALNAVIEASRAGEQGQGFTLVADEVRKLAERAAAAAKEIERLIVGIQSDIGDAVGGMERQGERIEVQAAAATQAQHALEKVGAVTNEASVTMEEIATTADAQASGAERLGEAVSQIASAATGVQRSSDQTRRSSAELSKLSDELRARVERPAEA